VIRTPFLKTCWKKNWSLKVTNKMEPTNKITNSKPIPHIPLPFREVIADVLKVKPPEKARATENKNKPRRKP
jgi:hypothetical protein